MYQTSSLVLLMVLLLQVAACPAHVIAVSVVIPSVILIALFVVILILLYKTNHLVFGGRSGEYHVAEPKFKTRPSTEKSYINFGCENIDTFNGEKNGNGNADWHPVKHHVTLASPRLENLGLTIQRDLSGRVVVTSAVPDSSAIVQSNIRPGDIIKSIKINFENITAEEAAAIISQVGKHETCVEIERNQSVGHSFPEVKITNEANGNYAYDTIEETMPDTSNSQESKESAFNVHNVTNSTAFDNTDINENSKNIISSTPYKQEITKKPVLVTDETIFHEKQEDLAVFDNDDASPFGHHPSFDASLDIDDIFRKTFSRKISEAQSTEEASFVSDRPVDETTGSIPSKRSEIHIESSKYNFNDEEMENFDDTLLVDKNILKNEGDVDATIHAFIKPKCSNWPDDFTMTKSDNDADEHTSYNDNDAFCDLVDILRNDLNSLPEEETSVEPEYSENVSENSVIETPLEKCTKTKEEASYKTLSNEDLKPKDMGSADTCSNKKDSEVIINNEIELEQQEQQPGSDSNVENSRNEQTLDISNYKTDNNEGSLDTTNDESYLSTYDNLWKSMSLSDELEKMFAPNETRDTSGIDTTADTEHNSLSYKHESLGSTKEEYNTNNSFNSGLENNSSSNFNLSVSSDKCSGEIGSGSLNEHRYIHVDHKLDSSSVDMTPSITINDRQTLSNANEINECVLYVDKESNDSNLNEHAVISVIDETRDANDNASCLEDNQYGSNANKPLIQIIEIDEDDSNRNCSEEPKDGCKSQRNNLENISDSEEGSSTDNANLFNSAPIWDTSGRGDDLSQLRLSNSSPQLEDKQELDTDSTVKLNPELSTSMENLAQLSNSPSISSIASDTGPASM